LALPICRRQEHGLFLPALRVALEPLDFRHVGGALFPQLGFQAAHTLFAVGE
jgi:hypothetical protein